MARKLSGIIYRLCFVFLGILILSSMFLEAQGQLSVVTRKQDGKRMRNSSGLFDPESNADSFRIEPGETVVLADLDGPGEIQHIWFTIGAYERRYPRSMVFRIYWDGDDIPSSEDARITGFKWHIQDPIMFSKSLKVEVERRSYTATVTAVNRIYGLETGKFPKRKNHNLKGKKSLA